MLLAGALGAAFPAGAATYFVNASAVCAGADGSTSKPFCKIQDGVNKAATGDTVQVAAGTYAEDVSIIDKGLKVLGADPATTIVQGFQQSFRIDTNGANSATNTEIAGFTLTGGSSYGVGSSSSRVSFWVHNCIIVGFPIGVYIADGATARITNNVIANSAGQAVYNNSRGTYTIVTLYGNVLMRNQTGVYAGACQAYVYSSFNRYFDNTTNRSNANCGGSAFVSSTNDSDNSDPKFVDAGNGDYRLQIASPSLDAGRPGGADQDPDGSRNDQGAYGGPGAVGFWPKTAGLPVVTGLSSTPHDVAIGGTFTINGVGKAQ